jgi:hypothetical protein
MLFVEHDGGRAAAGFKGTTGDCAVRAVAIAAELPYREVYRALARAMGAIGQPRSVRHGVDRKVMRRYMHEIGWLWVPTMRIGQGCTVHVRADELPSGRLVLALSGHYTAVIDGVVYDAYDPSREGSRCVYGYFKRGEQGK